MIIPQKNNIWFVLVYPKYTIADVINIKNHFDNHQKFYCITDHKYNSYPNDINFLQCKEYDLYAWWNKILLFKFDDEVNSHSNKNFYFDLDLVINDKNCINTILNQIDDEYLTLIDTHWKNDQYFNYGKKLFGKNLYKYTQYGNSSIMSWKTSSQRYLFDKLNEDLDFHINDNFGDDPFINRYGKINYFKNIKFGYSKDSQIEL